MSSYGEKANIVGNVSISSNLNVGTLRINSGTITDTSGVVDFGGDNVLTTGYVGIGTNNPSYKLHIIGTQYGVSNSAHYDMEIGNYDGTSYNTMVSLGTDQSAYDSGGISLWQNGSVESVRLSGNSANYFNGPNIKVGIGTTNPQYQLDLGKGYGNTNEKTAKKLSVYNDGGVGNDFYGLGISPGTLNLYADCDTTDTPQMVLTSTGNVGIGTINPYTSLQIGSSASASTFRTGGISNFYTWLDGGNHDTTPHIFVGGTGLASSTPSTIGYGWGWFYQTDGAYSLKRKNGSGFVTCLIANRANGNVGIGTDNPVQKLDVNGGNLRVRGTDTSNGYMYITSDNIEIGESRTSDGVSFIDLHSSVSIDFSTRIIRGGGANANLDIINAGTGNMVFATNWTNAIVIDGSQNVGIGLTPTVAKLEVQDTTNKNVIYTRATNASFTSVANTIEVTRAATSAYSFLQAYSSGAGDLEHHLRGDGNAYCDGSWNGGGADYAEFFESATGISLPLGKCVVIQYDEDSSITLVREYDEVLDKPEDIIGVVRAKKECRGASFVGGNHSEKWKGKYLTNDFGEYIYEPYDCVEFVDEDGKEHSYECDKIPEFVEDKKDKDGNSIPLKVPDDAKTDTLKRKKLNPDYNKNLEYIPYEERDEKVLIALVGQIPMLKSQVMNPSWRKCYSISEILDMVYIR